MGRRREGGMEGKRMGEREGKRERPLSLCMPIVVWGAYWPRVIWLLILKAGNGGRLDGEHCSVFLQLAQQCGPHGLIIGHRHMIFHHKHQISFLVQSRKQSLICYETTCLRLERHPFLEKCTSFWVFWCLIMVLLYSFWPGRINWNQNAS